MIRDLLPLLAGLAVAAIVYTTRELRRNRHRINPALPDLTMEEAWAIWTQSAETKPDNVFATALAEQGVLTPPVESEAMKGLLEGEKLYQEADHPRLALRSAILDNAAIAMHLDAISGFGEAERAALLRRLLSLRPQGPLFLAERAFFAKHSGVRSGAPTTLAPGASAGEQSRPSGSY